MEQTIIYLTIATYTTLFCSFILKETLSDSFFCGLIWPLYYLEIFKGCLKKILTKK